MDIQKELKFLTLLRSKVNKVIGKISIKEPLLEISAMLGSRIDELREEIKALKL